MQHASHEHEACDHGDHDHEHGVDEHVPAQLRFAIVLLAITLVAEVVGGILSHSLALLADAGHVFMDLFALGMSLAAVTLARQPATTTRTFGWHRVEVLAALLNGLLLIGLALGLLHEAWLRCRAPAAVLSVPMLVVAAIGLVVNVVIAVRLHAHHHDDLNMKSAYLHVVGDTLASVGVVAAALVIMSTGWTVVDPIVSVAINVLILGGAVRVILKSGHILLEGVPDKLSLPVVADAIRTTKGVTNVHDLHIWTVCSHIVSLSCHIGIDSQTPADHDRLIREVREMLQTKFGILHTTIQVDYEQCGTGVVTQDMRHPHRR